MVAGTILEEVRGQIMKDIVLLETMKVAGRDYRVLKLQFAAGEFDMVVYDTEESCCVIYGIERSEKAVLNQYSIRWTEKSANKQREDLEMETGVSYQKVENYYVR